MGARRLHGIRGDELVARHDADRGRADAVKAKDGFAAQLARAFPGTVRDLCNLMKPAVPSAKPCRMQHPVGMKDRATRGELRAGNISAWGWDRLFAAANSI